MNIDADMPEIEVAAADGTYVGLRGSTVNLFLGMRYAKPPVDDLRWAEPRPIDPTRDRLRARSFGQDSLQPNPASNDPRPGMAVTGGEDCLFLNVFSPIEGRSLPVMVWIHGGAFVFGSGRDVDPRPFVATYHVIVVTFNYRLGALGFLAHPELAEGAGNFGLLDQQEALRWVQRNIAAFGGDPNRVTIFGESSGGVSVILNMLSPGAKGLFARAINQSGPCKALDRSVAQQRGRAYARNAGCPTGASAIAHLRSRPAEEVALISAGPIGLGDTAWQPCFGTQVVPQGFGALASGAFNRVPLINGSNRDEGNLFALGIDALLPNEAAYHANLKVQFGDQAEAVLAHYAPRKQGSIARAYASYITDWLFACPAHKANRLMAAHTPVYAYEFCDSNAPHTLPIPNGFESLGAFHTAEIQYVFGTASPDFAAPERFQAEQRTLSLAMQSAWVSFARDGVPRLADGAKWPIATAQGTPVVQLDPNATRLGHDFAQAHHFDFWCEILK